MNWDVVASFVRQLLTMAGAYAVTKGYVDGSNMEAIIGGVLAVGSVIWSYTHHKDTPA